MVQLGHFSISLMWTLTLLAAICFLHVQLPVAATSHGKAVYPNHGIIKGMNGFNSWSPGSHIHSPLIASNQSDWMGDNFELLSDLTLKQMILPGTHDSGAYALTDQLAPDITGSELLNAAIEIAEKLGIQVEDVITPWALSQTTTLYQQAMGGIRYFDLRICWNGSDFDTYHFETGNTIHTLMLDLSQFIREHPQEIIVIEGQLWQPLNDTIPLDDKLDLVAWLLYTFDEVLYPERPAFNMTYGDLLQSNYRVVFTIDDEDMYQAGVSPSTGEQLLWFGNGTIWNTYANTHDYTNMSSFDTTQIQTFNSVNQTTGGSPISCDRFQTNSSCLYKISWTLTTDAIAILESILPDKPHSLIEMADTANEQLQTFVEQGWIVQAKLQLGNIFIIDDFLNSPMVSIVIQQNLALGQEKATSAALQEIANEIK